MGSFKRSCAVLALAAASGGCATIVDSNRQVVALQTIEDNREIAGVGCVLANQAGRWFVTSPGHVTISKSAGDLSVDCRKASGASTGRELIASRFDTGSLIGNLALSGGLGYYVDRRSGAGFDYPATLTIIMRKSGAAEDETPETAGNVIY